MKLYRHTFTGVIVTPEPSANVVLGRILQDFDEQDVEDVLLTPVQHHGYGHGYCDIVLTCEVADPPQREAYSSYIEWRNAYNDWKRSLPTTAMRESLKFVEEKA